MLEVYGQANTRSLRVTWMLEELQQKYQYTPVALTKGEGRTPEYLGVNPGGKVPTLKDDDLVLTESGAILSYLADKFSEKALIPQVGSAERGKFNQWSYFAICELEQPMWTIAKHRFAIPPKYRVADINPTAVWEFQVALKVLSKGLADQKYILGDEFSAADILIAHSLNWAVAFQQPIEQENLQAYMARLNQRPALAAAIAREKQVG